MHGAFAPKDEELPRVPSFSSSESGKEGSNGASDSTKNVKIESDLADHIAEKWLVELESAKRIVSLAYQAAQSADLDPLLILAVVARESAFKFNGNAGNLKVQVPGRSIDPAWAHGLMQIAGRFHPEKMPLDAHGNMRVTTDEENLHIGSRILREYLDRSRGNLTHALQRYNGNLVPGDTRFARYVLRVRDQFAAVTADT